MEAQRDIVLVRPLINYERNSPFFLPLGLLCIAAALRESNFPVEIIDFEFEFRRGNSDLASAKYFELSCQQIMSRRPKLVGITVLADTLPTALLMGRFLKRHHKEIKVILGGPGVFGTAHYLLKSFPECADYICSGEGEIAMCDLARNLLSLETEDIPMGIYGQVGRGLHYGGKRPFAKLDELPRPAYELLPINDYLELASPRIFDVYIGSGCTYACKFCITSTFWDREFRIKSPALILSELDFLNREFGLLQFNFLHDNFANNRNYLHNFLDYFCAYNKKYEWGCAVRPDNVSHRELERMKASGCFQIFCGTDAGSDEILKAMAKMPNAKRSYDFFQNCKDLQIEFETNTIIGYPNEADSDLEDSLEIIMDARYFGAASSDASILQPLPGSAVTLENLKNLTFVETNSIGTFIPEEAREMARLNASTFPSFYFIRKNNREFAFYEKCLQLIRYFTRHFTNTIRILKAYCSVRYVDLFVHLLESGYQLKDNFSEVLSGFEIDDRNAKLAQAMFEYELAIENLLDLDIPSQMKNIYAEPTANLTNVNHILLEIPFAIHKIISSTGNLPSIQDLENDSVYLLYVQGQPHDYEVITLHLTGNQIEFWKRLQGLYSDDGFNDFYSELKSEPFFSKRDQKTVGISWSLLELFASLHNESQTERFRC